MTAYVKAGATVFVDASATTEVVQNLALDDAVIDAEGDVTSIEELSTKEQGEEFTFTTASGSFTCSAATQLQVVVNGQEKWLAATSIAAGMLLRHVSAAGIETTKQITNIAYSSAGTADLYGAIKLASNKPITYNGHPAK